MIYTTYFGKLNSKSFHTDKITPIAICAKPPEGWSGKMYKQLAPHYNFFSQYKEDNNFAAFRDAYRHEVLASLDPKFVGHQLILEAATGKDIALVCYEKDPSVCHRSLVAEWLRSAGFEVKEL